MKTIERATDADGHFVLVTLDPPRDTPAVLAELAAVLSRMTTARGLAHASTLPIIDGNGVLVQERSNGYVTETIEALRSLSSISH